MSFDYRFDIEDYDVDKKVHINLTEAAWLVIDEDCLNFSDSNEKFSFSGFLNRIFTNYYQKADATINERFNEKVQQLEKLYLSEEFSNLDKKSIEMFINKYAKVYENELIHKAKSYLKGEGKKLRVNRQNIDILRESLEANHYDGIIGEYLRAIFSEYSSKSNYVREQIFFADTINKIQNAIYREKKLKITLNDKTSVKGDRKYTRKFYVTPYKIIQDKTNTFNYLVGLSEEIIETTILDENGQERRTHIVKEKEIVSYRISRINKIDIQVSMGAHLSKETCAQIENKLKNNDVMFLASKPSTVKVRFTEKGLESFKRQVYMRPKIYTVDEEDPHIYTFTCTEIQAMNYFFKMGWDAYIMEPSNLCEQFKKRYHRGYKSYLGMNKQEIFESEKEEQPIL